MIEEVFFKNSMQKKYIFVDKEEKSILIIK